MAKFDDDYARYRQLRLEFDEAEQAGDAERALALALELQALTELAESRPLARIMRALRPFRRIIERYQDYTDAVKLGRATEELENWMKHNPDATEEQKIAAAQRIHAKYGGLYIRSYPGGPRRLMSPENRQLARDEAAAYEAMHAPGATEEEKKVAASRLASLRACE
jgi:hypothetical protein